ncbi:MAG: hypothetical protein LAP39_19305 [Acidobacteriia bacterium]|nr:hypothetical protein [Terriglobia bacterium]
MFRNGLAILLAVLMVLPLQAGQRASPTVQEQVGQIAKGSIIGVKTKLKAMKKITGRLGEVTAEGFEVQVARGQKVDNVKLRFAEVKSVKIVGKESRAERAVVYAILAGVATVVVVLVVVLIQYRHNE